MSYFCNFNAHINGISYIQGNLKGGKVKAVESLNAQLSLRHKEGGPTQIPFVTEAIHRSMR